MQDRAWWLTLLQWSLWGVLMAVVRGWLGRSRLRARPAAEARRLALPPAMLVLGLACLAFFGGAAVVSNVFPDRTSTWWTTAVFVGFALLGLALVLAYFLEVHEVSDDGLASRNLFGITRHLRWRDLGDVRFAPVMQWFRLETRSGIVARVSVMVMGLPEFARLLLRHAPTGAIGPETLEILRATADGSPPSVQ